MAEQNKTTNQSTKTETTSAIAAKKDNLTHRPDQAVEESNATDIVEIISSLP